MIAEADSENLARAFLATIADPRAPWLPSFNAWAADRGLTVRDAKPILAAVLRARVFEATARFRSRTRTTTRAAR